MLKTRCLKLSPVAAAACAWSSPTFSPASTARDRNGPFSTPHQTTASARRFGSKAEQRHVDGLLQLVMNSTGDSADAAARLHGALNLPSANAVKLITN
jgi:hypothetical protein